MTNRFGVYVHIPFCVHKCSYCDFYSFTKYEGADFARLADAITHEVADAAKWLRLRGESLPAATSIFFGGGTPSLLPIPLLAKICDAIWSELEIAPSAEVTLEANPETVHPEFCEGLKARTPINRVSLGAQSFRPEHLKSLERLGSAESIARAAGLLQNHGLDNFNLDLIFAIPGQTEEAMLDDIAAAASLGAKHISFYNLTLKPAHGLYRQLPTSDAAADLYEAGIAKLASLGYAQYEISNFAQPGCESRHNWLYWDGGDFLGVGPSAASRFFWDRRFHHRKQFSDYRRYLEGGAFPTPPFESSSGAQTVLEATFLELRKRGGVDLAAFETRYGYDLTRAKKFPLFLKERLLVHDQGRLELTPRGQMLADSVTEALVDWDELEEK